jgi:hypothetical protein
VALFPDRASARVFAAGAPGSGLTILDLAIDDVGAHRRGAGILRNGTK